MQRRLESGIIILERSTRKGGNTYRPGYALIQEYREGRPIRGVYEGCAVDFPDIPGQIVIEGELEHRPSKIMPSDGYLVTLRPGLPPASFGRFEINFFWENSFQINRDSDSWEFHNRLGVDTEKFLHLGTDADERLWRAKIVKHHITLPFNLDLRG